MAASVDTGNGLDTVMVNQGWDMVAEIPLFGATLAGLVLLMLLGHRFMMARERAAAENLDRVLGSHKETVERISLAHENAGRDFKEGLQRHAETYERSIDRLAQALSDQVSQAIQAAARVRS